MGYLLLLLGIGIWTLAHYFKRLAPKTRAAMGNGGKGAVALGCVAGLLLMIVGYRIAPFDPIWSPPIWLTYLNNLLMVLAIILFGMSATTGSLRGRMRHPMLASVKVWAVAHLLVNGDLASILLFGGMLAWAGGAVLLINRAETWERPTPGGVRGDVKLAVISAFVYIIAVVIHQWLGVPPLA